MAREFFGLNSKLAFENFFDRQKVIKAVDRKTRAAMMFIGGTTRTIAKNSIKKSTGTTLHSPPGKPARTQTGILKRTIFFEYDPIKRRMTAGPKKLPKTSGLKSSKTVPQLLEEGGTATPTKPRFIRVRPRTLKKRRRRKNEAKFIWVRLPNKPFKYRARPTMKLAQQKAFTSQKLRKAFGVIGFNKR